MKKNVKFALAILGGFVVLGIILCAVVFSILNKQQNADFYSLGSDEIASVKYVVGVRKISGISISTENGVSVYTYEYKSETSAADIEQYLTYLLVEEGFIFTTLNQNSDQPVYAKASADEGRILILTIFDTGFGYTLSIQKGEGALPAPK